MEDPKGSRAECIDLQAVTFSLLCITRRASRSSSLSSTARPQARQSLVGTRCASVSDPAEFPAGLIDEGEDAATTALRELHEETGYTGAGVTVRSVSPVLVKDPGWVSVFLGLR